MESSIPNYNSNKNVFLVENVAVMRPSTKDNKCVRQPLTRNYLVYWTAYFNFGFHIGIIPFRFKRNPSSGELNLYAHPVQKVISLLLNFVGALAMLQRFRLFNYERASQDPIRYVLLLQIVTDILYIGIFLHVYRRRGATFSILYNKLQRIQKEVPHNDTTKMILATIFCTLFACLAHRRTIDHFVINGMDFGPLINEYKTRTKLVFNLNPDSGVPFVVMVLLYLSEIVGDIMCQCIDLIVYFTIIMLNEIVADFQSFLNENCHTPNEVLAEYENLKEDCNLINETVKYFVVGYLTASLAFYAIAFSDISEAIMPLTPLQFFIYASFFLYLAASTNKKMDGFKLWIQKRRREISEIDLIVLLDELNPRSKVGLSVGGLFCINFNFLGSMAGLMLTYIVVIVQMRTIKPVDEHSNLCACCNLTHLSQIT